MNTGYPRSGYPLEIIAALTPPAMLVRVAALRFLREESCYGTYRSLIK